MRIVAAITLAALLFGCASDDVPITPAPLAATRNCPTVDKTWTDAQLHDLKLALAPLPDGSPLVKMAIEWNRLRVDALACARS